MDSFIYALVLVPALRELLPRSGIGADQASIGFYGGLLFAIFLLGWGFAFLWGPIADRFGRVRTLMLTILCYSFSRFSERGEPTSGSWQRFGFFAGIGIGGEWTLGGVFVAEEWPESRRQKGAAYMHTGYYFGTFLAAIVNYTVGAHYGWRAVFAVGGAPALLVAFIRYGVSEPERWKRRIGELGHRWTAGQRFLRAVLGGVSAADDRERRAVAGLDDRTVGGIGVRAVVGDVSCSTSPDSAPSDAARMASYATMLLSPERSSAACCCRFWPHATAPRSTLALLLRR